MLALIIIGVIVLLITLIMLIPVGADLSYVGGELKVSAKVAGILLQLIPKTETGKDKPSKEKKPKKEKKGKKDKESTADGSGTKPKKKLNFNIEEIFDIIKAALTGVGNLGRKINVDRFLLRYTSAGNDPYNCAVTYGYVNAGLSALAPICSKRFKVKDLDVSTNIDFTLEKLELDFAVALTIRIGQVFGAVLGIAFGALGVLIRNKKRLRVEAKQAKKASKAEYDKQNIQIEERKENNGQ